MINEINKILSSWDPIEVGQPYSLNEYKSYANHIGIYLDDEIRLRAYLINILNQMGLAYDENRFDQKKDLDDVIVKLMSLKK